MKISIEIEEEILDNLVASKLKEVIERCYEEIVELRNKESLQMYETHDLFDNLAMIDHLFNVYGYFTLYVGELDYIMEDL